MNKKFSLIRYIQIVMAILILTSIAVFTTPSSADDTTVEGMRRENMMAIAERFLTYPWTATPDNAWHKDMVDTPDLPNCSDPWGCWDFEPAQNIGVPYYWGGATSVEDDPDDGIPDLYLKPHDGTPLMHFGKKLDLNYPAGDIGTGDGPQWTYANGVDCIGFVGQIWRRGSRLNMSTALEVARPIRFKDLRAGDIVMKYILGDNDNHVVLFKEWVNYVPGSGEPLPGTRFRVYEAAKQPKKVVLSVYELKSIESTDSNNKALKAFFRGRYYETDKTEIRRISYCDPNSCKDDGVYELGNYYPYTYFNPIDVVIIIDRSGSMSTENRMRKAKDAAKMFVDLMRPGDKIGVVAFSSSAEDIFFLTEIDMYNEELGETSLVKNNAKGYIESISPSGNTSIGSGLQKGYAQLESPIGEGDPTRLMILLSDGEENTDPRVTDELLDTINQDNIVVHTLGIGEQIDDELLWKIANRTGGAYHYSGSDLMDLFNSIFVKTYGEVVIRSVAGTVPLGATVEQSIHIDSTISSVTFSLTWPGSDLDLTLVQPDGRLINPSVAVADRDITFTSGPTYEFYNVFAPQPGEWKLRIYGKAMTGTEEDYGVFVSADDSMTLSVNVDKLQYFTHDPINITASVLDASITDPLGSEYVRGATMQVSVEDPLLNQYSFELYDDGLHGDGEADDGVYSNSFSDTGLEGSYNFNVLISGANNRDGQPFTREYALSTVVSERVFPHTSVLDDFNRADGPIGSNWSGNKSRYAISSNQLKVNSNNSDAYIFWNSTPFGSDQEAYITFSDLLSSASEQDLLLKSQSASTWGSGVLEVWYDAPNQRVKVYTYKWPQGWVQHGADIPVAFVDGDTFGARARPEGTVEVYRNGELLATRDITSWPHYADGGYIGLWFIGAYNARLDDFGGGTVSGGESLMMPMQSSGTQIEDGQLDMELQDADVFWQGVPLGTGQAASVTFATLHTDTGSERPKPQSNGIWGEGVVEVLYDVGEQRIQIWMYEPGEGWERFGKNMPVEFKDGDQFRALVGPDGVLELYRNGKLFAKQKIDSAGSPRLSMIR